jgi:hypothetical protein
MEKFEKIIINDKEQLDEVMHFRIGGSWDYIENRYPAVYPCMLVMDEKHRSIWDFIYRYEVKPLFIQLPEKMPNEPWEDYKERYNQAVTTINLAMEDVFHKLIPLR